LGVGISRMESLLPTSIE